MKICWDNLEKMKYSSKIGKWYNGKGGGYTERESCRNCGESFLSRENGSDFCCRVCSSSGKHNGMYGKTHTDEVKKLLKENIKESQKTIKKRYGVDNISQLEEIKNKKGQFIISFENVDKYLKKKGYLLLKLDGVNKHAIMKVVCPNGHKFEIRYTAFKAGHRCRECFYDKLRQKGIQDLEGFELYKKLVYQHTQKSYKKYKEIINPMNLRRGRKTYHLDHRFSICEGFKNNIPPEVIGSYVNLEIISNTKNCSKQEKCSITKKELINEYIGKTKSL